MELKPTGGKLATVVDVNCGPTVRKFSTTSGAACELHLVRTSKMSLLADTLH